MTREQKIQKRKARAKARKEKRNEAYRLKIRQAIESDCNFFQLAQGGAVCKYCGSVQQWCNVCMAWTCFGCSEYGTCMCS
jgi:hypothetical protein